MVPRITVTQILKVVVPALVASLLVTQALSAATRSKRVPAITKPKFDPTAKKVELFKGIKDGSLTAQLILKNSRQGNVLIKNKTDQPLTVKLPNAFVGVQVLKQGGMMGGGGGGMMGGGGGGQSGGGGGGQSSGGGAGGGGQGGGMGGGMGGGGGGMGMFSIPPQKVVRLRYHGVCLEHGKREPSSRMRYKLIPVEEYSKDPGLNELLTLVAQRRIPTPVAQAAAWNINSKMPWQTLAAKRRSRLGGGFHPPYFHLQHLIRARQVVAYAKARGAERQRNASKGKAESVPQGEPTRPARGVRNFRTTSTAR